MIRVASITQTCHACPSQWEGLLDDGREVYVRYRFGWLSISIRVSGEELFSKFCGEDCDDEADAARWREECQQWAEGMISSMKVMREFSKGEPISFDGLMDYDQLRQHTAGVIEWPENETP